jgi:multidrug efflux pump subunit AcrA (membrane-fusion protein)
VDEANIQKNTVQVKVSIESPSPVLRPEMLARVRFFGARTGGAGGGPPAPGGSASAGGSGRLLVHRSGLQHAQGGQAHAWVVDRERDAAVMRTVRLGGESSVGWVEVLDGLRAGDRVIVGDVGRLSEGRRVRVLGEADEAPDHDGGHP